MANFGSVVDLVTAVAGLAVVTVDVGTTAAVFVPVADAAC